MFKTPLGVALAAAALLLVLSPEARKMARKLAIKGTETALDLSEKTKEAAESVKHQFQSVVEEARKEQHQTH